MIWRTLLWPAVSRREISLSGQPRPAIIQKADKVAKTASAFVRKVPKARYRVGGELVQLNLTPVNIAHRASRASRLYSP